ncbi:MAG TPA: hypothetical protein PKI46_03790 [Bacteroidales bacterium]|nr:hypothetical protein [Bacteroidales bacterium]
MKQAIDDLYTLLTGNVLLQNDIGNNVKVETFCKYANPLIETFPAILLIRKSKAKQIKTVSSGYIENFTIDIMAMTQQFETDYVTMTGLEQLDKLVKNIETILQQNPKINGSYLDSNIDGTDYDSFINSNYINFIATITLTMQRRVVYN